MYETTSDSLAYVTDRLSQMAKKRSEEDDRQSDVLFQRIVEGNLINQFEFVVGKKNQLIATLLECGKKDIITFERAIQAIASLPYPPSGVYAGHMPGAEWDIPRAVSPDAPDPIRSFQARVYGQTQSSITFSNEGQLRHHISTEMTGPPRLSGSYSPPTGEDVSIPSIPLTDRRALMLALKITESHLSALVLHCVLDEGRSGKQSLTDLAAQIDLLMSRHELRPEVKTVVSPAATTEAPPTEPKKQLLPFPDLRVASGERAPVELIAVMNIISRYLDRMTKETLPQHAQLYNDLFETLIQEDGTLNSVVAELWKKISTSDSSSFQRWEQFVNQRFAEILHPHMLAQAKKHFINTHSPGNPQLNFQNLDADQKQQWRQYMYARTIIVNSLVGMMCGLRMKELGMTETIVLDSNMPISNVFRDVAEDALNAHFPANGGAWEWNAKDHAGYQDAVRQSFAVQTKLLQQSVNQTLPQVPLKSMLALNTGASGGGAASQLRRFF